MSDYGDRLKRALMHADLSQAELARRIGIKQQGVNYLCSRATGSKHSAAIARALGVSLVWLTEGKGVMARGPNEPIKNEGNVSAPRPPARWAPIVSWANAGAFEEVVDCYEPGDAENWYPIPPGVKCSASSFWTEVQGRSMVNTAGGTSYPPGSLLLVDPEVRDAITGALVIARLSDSHEATFKRLSVEGGRCYLEPLNTQYSVIEIDCDAQIIGTVKLAVITPG